MASLNKVILIGHLTKDPELKQSQSGISVVTFTIGVNRRVAKDAEQKSDFINIVAWRKTAEFVARYFTKGKPICVCGALRTRSYTDNSGSKRYVTEVLADEVGFAESKSEPAPNSAAYVPDAYTSAPSPQFEDVPDDGDLPF